MGRKGDALLDLPQLLRRGAAEEGVDALAD
jgi:hypothetical protein